MSAMLRFSCLLLLATILALVAGCSQFDLSKPIPWPKGFEDDPAVPSKVVAMWADTVRHQSNSPPERGFGGRLMFYGREPKKPIKVEGTLVVYAFDEAGRKRDNAAPDRKFVFPAEQFTKHYSKSELGHSYSVWLPWDQVGGEEKDVSLIVRFMPKAGPVVIGDQTKHILPGKKTPPQFANTEVRQHVGQSAPRDYGVRGVSYNGPPPFDPAAVSNPRPKRQMSTTTITVPRRYGSRTPVAMIGPRSRVRRAPPVEDGAGGTPTAQMPASAHSAAATAAPQRSLPPQAHFSQSRSQLLNERIARLSRGHGPWQRHPGASQSHPEPAPVRQSGNGSSTF